MDSFCFCGGDRRCRKGASQRHCLDLVTQCTLMVKVTLRHTCHSSAEFSLAGSPPGFARDQVVLREFDGVPGGLSVTQDERPPRPRSQIHGLVAKASAQQGPAFVIGDDLCGGSRVVASGWCGPCGKRQLEVGLDHLGLEYVSVLRSAAACGLMSNSISRLMPTKGICRPWRGAHPWSARSASMSLSGRGVTGRADRRTHRHPAHRL
jgi:hypothetical protein